MSYTILPEILDCKEFVNADNIAAGISPFNPEGVAIEAGRIMLKRVDELLGQKVDFAFETTLATKSFVPFIKACQHKGYVVNLLYFWLDTPETSYRRVALRVSKGGHNIPVDIIKRRYYRGIYNLINLYIPICNKWAVLNNVTSPSMIVAHGTPELGKSILNEEIWRTILKQANESKD